MLAILFASQTIAAAFDTHNEHQGIEFSTTHKSLDDSHQSHEELAFALDSLANGDGKQEGFDCHHCCHCHTPSSLCIVDLTANQILPKLHFSFINHQITHISLRVSPKHRPPIV